jgi:hypothetical protein
VRRPYAAALIALVGASFLVRTALAWLRSVPALFPDEYIYASIGRSFAESGRPLIRGASPHFPALLQPLVTAPAWLVDDVGIAFRLVQATSALAMSLAAVPVFLLARRLGLGGRVALVLAAFALLVPDLLYASFVSSEPFAYPLLLGCVYLAVRVLARPTPRAQLAFVALAGLTTLARMQFVVLPVVFALTTVVVGARQQRVRKAVREQALPLALFGVATAAMLASGPSRSIGVYRWLLGRHAEPLGIVHWAALDAMTLAYAAGWIIVPGALLGLWLAVTRPRSTEELAFGTTTVLLGTALLLEAGVLQASLTLEREIQERYVFYAVPLLAVGFALYAARGWPLRVTHLALAAALIVVSVRLPLSGYAVASTVDGSPILFGVYWLTGKLGRPGDASALIAAAVGVMSLVAVLASRRPRVGTPVVLALALLALGAASAGAVALDVASTASLKRAYLPRDPSWVDRARVGDVTLLQSYSGVRAITLQELFWNRSIKRVVLLPGAARFDAFRTEQARASGDGSLFVSGREVTGPVLVDTFGSTVRLRGARVLESGPTATLWLPVRAERPRLAFYALGRYYDEWLGSAGAFFAWPQQVGARVSGWISMRLTAQRSLGSARLTFNDGQTRRSVTIPAGASRLVRIPVCAVRRARVTFNSNVQALVGLRPVSVRSTVPTFTQSPSACRGRASAA